MEVRTWDNQRSFKRFLIPAAAGWAGSQVQELVSKIQNLENTFCWDQGLALLLPGMRNFFTTKPAFSTCIMNCSSSGIFLRHLHKTIKRK